MARINLESVKHRDPDKKRSTITLKNNRHEDKYRRYRSRYKEYRLKFTKFYSKSCRYVSKYESYRIKYLTYFTKFKYIKYACITSVLLNIAFIIQYLLSKG